MIRHRLLSLCLLPLILAGCGHMGSFVPTIDRSVQSPNHSSRAQFLVLHYTAAPLERSVELLTQAQVSSHYLVTDEPQPRILQLVDESRAAWHAGLSEWRGRTWLNASAIGIEIVHPGYIDHPDGTREWPPYSTAQMDAVEFLVKDIVERHKIDPRNVVAHSDIAPTRKSDPGPRFDWQRLGEAGLIPWPNATVVQAMEAQFLQRGLPDVFWFQDSLQRIGYAVPQNGQLDEATRAALRAFQMRYRPSDFAGEPDLGTAARLQALLPAAN